MLISSKAATSTEWTPRKLRRKLANQHQQIHSGLRLTITFLAALPVSQGGSRRCGKLTNERFRKRGEIPRALASDQKRLPHACALRGGCSNGLHDSTWHFIFLTIGLCFLATQIAPMLGLSTFRMRAPEASLWNQRLPTACDLEVGRGVAGLCANGTYSTVRRQNQPNLDDLAGTIVH